MTLDRSTSTIPAGAARVSETCGPVKMEGENIR